MDERVDVLIPTCNRATALAVTLTALASQQPALRIVMSDQSNDLHALDAPELQGVLRYVRHLGHTVEVHRHWPRRGMAEQRAFLLAQARSAHCLFLDDDVITRAGLVAQMKDLLLREACGFVGSALHGLSHAEDHRPHEEAITFWEHGVRPETVAPGSDAWQRHRLHNAANLLHVQQRLGLSPLMPPSMAQPVPQTSPGLMPRPYRVAWVGGCVMYDTAKLRDCGGFDFWEALPADHCGEDVLAQLRVMAKYGGCGLIPSGAYHLELPTTLPDRRINAPLALGPAPAEKRLE